MHILCVSGGDSLEAGAEDGLLVVVVKSAAVCERAAQARVDECFSEWRSRVGQENLTQHFHRKALERICARHRDPCSQRFGPVRVVLAGRGRVRLDCGGWVGETLDVWNGRIDLDPLES